MCQLGPVLTAENLDEVVARAAFLSKGKRCGSTWRLQFGHIRPVALGGTATVDGIRIECSSHNLYEAIRVFGPQFMAPYLGAIASSGGSHDS